MIKTQTSLLGVGVPKFPSLSSDVVTLLDSHGAVPCSCATADSGAFSADVDSFVRPSLDSVGIIQQKYADDSVDEGYCPDMVMVKGICEHGEIHWLTVPCKNRRCPVCGPKRRNKIAWKIANGIEVLGGSDGACWFVGTWDYDVEKKDAVKTVGKFVRFLREGHGLYKVVLARKIERFKRENGRAPNREERIALSDKVRAEIRRDFEYACTWEITRQGRLHCNLIIAPWQYVNQRLLADAWARFGGGRVAWVKRVGAGIGVEASKSRYSVGKYLVKAARYIAKFDQQVESGRGVTYSRGWPGLPQADKLPRRGRIKWERCDDRLGGEGQMFYQELALGYWQEIRFGEYVMTGNVEKCNCFDLDDGCVPSEDNS